MEEQINNTPNKVIPVDLEKEMKKSFLEYSMSVIVARALPDVRDGLKPVHRRILYTMHENNLTPDKAYRKCADTVGSVLGRYHPHGDASVYDAMVRMAQDFSVRYPLIDGHGNFGSVDGHPAAAYRYTEARMSKMSLDMLTDIGEEEMFVDFMGDKAGVRLQYGKDFKLYTAKNGALVTEQYTFAMDNHYEAEIRSFLDCIRTGEKTAANIDCAVLSSQIMQAIYDSSETHQEIRF